MRTYSTTSARSEVLSRPITPTSDVKEGEITHAKIKQLRKSRSRKSSVSSETGSTSDKIVKNVDKVDTHNIESQKQKETSPESTTSLKDVEKAVKVEEAKVPTEESKMSTPLDELIKAATIMNPRVFELPRELEIFSQFPGEDKSKFYFLFFFT